MQFSKEFEGELRSLLNRHSIEIDSNTPDWMLAEYVIYQLRIFGIMTRNREAWYGRHLHVDMDPLPLEEDDE